ncbi:Transmembrane protein 186 [Strongyloides ratti]|uniref:Transmembrane protein 186 n=1 Tax=Strongyloides ratti TaxID=34506 RepID=A0A090MZP6_STRRB|nr:Transmembrane protein 186 [Strongyloides ratti]CEF69299.1 Transmembrane protein 186 [Strongyloides ratti]
MLTWMAARQASLEALSRQQTVTQNVYRSVHRNERNIPTLRKKKVSGTSSDAVLNFNKQRSLQKMNPYERSEILNRIGGTCIRKLHTTSTKMNEKEMFNIKEIMNDLNFKPVYRFNGIWVGAFLAKAKLAQTVVSLLLIPYASYQLSTGFYDFKYFLIITFISLLAPIFLYIFSRFYSRVIGVISMSECNEYIRVGYLSFFGTRKNRYIKVDDIVPIFDTSSKPSRNLIVPLYQNSRKDHLYLATKSVEIVDEKRASSLFGSLKIFNIDKKLK